MPPLPATGLIELLERLAFPSGRTGMALSTLNDKINLPLVKIHAHRKNFQAVAEGKAHLPGAQHLALFIVTDKLIGER
ncbi:MAG: hypothetical protein HYV36_05505, partial [Lentisphaerae bacterium]|nr:hypothetical protein [Lentisphaerota bacterium]